MARGTHRYAGTEWKLPDYGVSGVAWSCIHAALLMDIREELRALNALLSCPNFTSIPASLRAIRRNTAKPRPKRKA